LGREHLNTLDDAYGLSLTLAGQAIELLDQGLADQGKYEEAEAMAQRALDGREKEVGREHLDTLNSADGLARILYCRGKYEAAEAMAQWALEGRERALGKDNPWTLATANLLANVRTITASTRQQRRCIDER